MKKNKQKFVGIIVVFVVVCLVGIIIFNLKPTKQDTTYSVKSTCVADYDSLTMKCDCEIIVDSQHYEYSNTLSLPDSGCGSVCDVLCDGYTKSLLRE